MDSFVTAGRHTIEGVVEAFSGGHPSEHASPRKPPYDEVAGQPSRRLALHDELEVADEVPGLVGPVTRAPPIDFSPSPAESRASMGFSDNTGYETATEGHGSSSYSGDMQDSRETTPKNISHNHHDGLNERSSAATMIRTPSSPKVPPRPQAYRPDGLLSRRRAESSKGRVKEGGSRIPIEKKIQTMSAPNMRVILEPSIESDDLKQDEMEAIPSAWSSPYLAPLSHIGRPSPPRKPKGNRVNPSPLSVESEASNDTIVEWSHNTTHPPVPTMTVSPPSVDDAPQSLKRSAARKEKKPLLLSLDDVARSDDTIVQWSTNLKKSPRLFDIHNDIGPVPTTGQSTAAEQTPPPAIQLSGVDTPVERAPPASSPLQETTGNRAPRAGTSPGKVVQLYDAPTDRHRHALPPRKLHTAASTPNTRPFRPLPASASPPATSSPQTFSPPGPPPISSPRTFSPPGPPPPHPPPLPPRTAPVSYSPPLPGALPARSEEDRFADFNGDFPKVLHREFKVLRREMMEEFAKQKRWVERLLRERDGYRGRLEEENGRLREELARVRGRAGAGEGRRR